MGSIVKLAKSSRINALILKRNRENSTKGGPDWCNFLSVMQERNELVMLLDSVRLGPQWLGGG